MRLVIAIDSSSIGGRKKPCRTNISEDHLVIRSRDNCLGLHTLVLDPGPHELVLLVMLMLVPAVHAEPWPMWRGGAGNGISDEKHAPLHWTATEGIAWKTRIAGTGYSSPIVWGDAIFLTSADLEAKARLLFCVDRESGRIRWQRVVVVADIERMHRLNSPASGTPATDGERVYTVFQAGNQLLVAAYDFSGQLIWKQSPGAFESRHGFNSSLVIYRDSLLLSGMQDGPDAFIARLDCESGKTIWKSPIDDPVRSFSTPLAIETPDGELVTLSGANRTFAFRPDNGQRVWVTPGPAEKTVSSLLYGNGLLYVAGGRDHQLLAIRPLAERPGQAPEVAWKASKGIPYVPSPLLYGDALHVMSDEGVCTQFDPLNGKVLLQRRLTSKFSGSPIGVGGLVYLTEDSGRTTIINAHDPFEIVTTNDLGEPVFASLAVSKGRLFIRGEEHLYCIR